MNINIILRLIIYGHTKLLFIYYKESSRYHQEIRQALKISDYVYVLELGRNKFEGPADDFKDLEKAFWV